MIAKYISSKSISSSIMYNELKVKDGSAKMLTTRNVHFETNNPKERIAILEFLAESNHRVKNNSTHIILSFSNSDNLSDATLIKVVDEYMTSLGFGYQPAFVYKHDDTATSHLHIVTTPVQLGGEKIDTAFIKLRSNEIRKDLEVKYNLVIAENQNAPKLETLEKGTRQYKQIKLKQAIEDMSFSSLNAYFDYVSTLGIHVDIKKYDRNGISQMGLMYQFDQECKPIKASGLYMKPTIGRIQKRINRPKSNELDKSGTLLVMPNSNIMLIVNKEKNSITHPHDIGMTKQSLLKHINESDFKKPQATNKNNVDRLNQVPVKVETLISRIYQNYKKQNAIYYESSLIDNYPFDFIAHTLNVEHAVPKDTAIKATNAFYEYKESKRYEILKREIDYFRTIALKRINFVNKLPITSESRQILLISLSVHASSSSGIISSVESDRVGFVLNKGSAIHKSDSTCIELSKNLNQESISFMKEWIEKGDLPYVGEKIDPSILQVLFKMGLWNKYDNSEEFEISPEHLKTLIAQMPNYEYEQEKFLREINVNRVRQMRRSR
jgi:hypothetical protein